METYIWKMKNSELDNTNLSLYLKFISSAATLDFGKVDVGNEDRFPIIIDYLSNTLVFLIGGLLMSLILSIILILVGIIGLKLF